MCAQQKSIGSLTPLSPLPDPEHQRLFNAENSTVSTNGRVFITGSVAVYEVLSAEDAASESQPYKHCDYREIRIPKAVPEDCFRNGITTFGDFLYLACAHVPQQEQLSAFPDWGSPLNKISQTKLLNIIWLMYTQNVAHVDSYIVRADLRKPDLQFDQLIKIPDKCFANGIAADKYGNLYVANSVPGSSCIYKIDHEIWITGEAQHSPECVWLAPLTHFVNGVKCKQHSLYYTWNQLLGLPGVGRIDVEQTHGNTQSSKPRHPSVRSLYSAMGFFDDFDVLDNDRIVLANGSDFLNLSAIMHLPMPSGSLIFVSGEGEVFNVVRDRKLFHPSSVKVVDHESKVFRKGEIIVTDKGEHGQYTAFVFTPDDACRSWFV